MMNITRFAGLSITAPVSTGFGDKARVDVSLVNFCAS
jgi:hypothetical protein